MRVHVPEETEPLAHPLSKGRKSLKQEEEEGEAAWLGLCLSDPGRQRKGSSLNPFSQNIRFLWPWNLSEHELKKEGTG